MQLQETPARWRVTSTADRLWVDIEDPKPEDVSVLGRQFPFHPLNLEDCLSKRQLDRVEDHDAYVFALLHFPSAGRERVVVGNQISIFVGKEYVVTLHGSSLTIVREMATALSVDESLRSMTMRSSAYLAYNIIDKLVDTIFPFLDKIRSDLEDIEDVVFDERLSAGKAILALRRETADLRRLISPLRSTLPETWNKLNKYALKDLRAYFDDVLSHIQKAWEVLEETKETVEIYKDTDFILSTDKTNKVLAILTIIFTLSIPATVVGAIYGMNVPLPGGNGESPPVFLGTFTSFIILIVAMFAPAVLMLWYFRRLGWI